MKRLLIVINVDWFFLSHRLPIAVEAKKQGYEVHILTDITDRLDELEKQGFIVHPLQMHRSNSNVVSLYKKFSPECIVIHSTLGPGTTERIQKKLSIPVIYSATRGVHKSMLRDLKRYTKFFAISSKAPKKKWAASLYSKKMAICGIRTQKMSKPETLELAKIVCDTSYLGWLINYSQISNMIANNYGVNYDEMWLFSDEIHKFLGNRPKMYPGYIGGHCVIPNLELIHNDTLDLIKNILD